MTRPPAFWGQPIIAGDAAGEAKVDCARELCPGKARHFLRSPAHRSMHESFIVDDRARLKLARIQWNRVDPVIHS